eukprot:4873251-Amphidinium_carterae.1
MAMMCFIVWTGLYFVVATQLGHATQVRGEKFETPRGHIQMLQLMLPFLVWLALASMSAFATTGSGIPGRSEQRNPCHVVPGC